jgi:hypothetical protein
MNFVDTPFCAGRKFCQVCRNLEGGAEWRKAMGKSFDLPGGTDFECPYGVRWGYDGAFRLGDAVASVAQPVAKAIDAIAGTHLQECGRCKRRRKRLNRLTS